VHHRLRSERKAQSSPSPSSSLNRETSLIQISKQKTRQQITATSSWAKKQALGWKTWKTLVIFHLPRHDDKERFGVLKDQCRGSLFRRFMTEQRMREKGISMRTLHCNCNCRLGQGGRVNLRLWIRVPVRLLDRDCSLVGGIRGRMLVLGLGMLVVEAVPVTVSDIVIDRL
jgi:hypothetical protein